MPMINRPVTMKNAGPWFHVGSAHGPQVRREESQPIHGFDSIGRGLRDLHDGTVEFFQDPGKVLRQMFQPKPKPEKDSLRDSRRDREERWQIQEKQQQDELNSLREQLKNAEASGNKEAARSLDEKIYHAERNAFLDWQAHEQQSSEE